LKNQTKPKFRRPYPWPQAWLLRRQFTRYRPPLRRHSRAGGAARCDGIAKQCHSKASQRKLEEETGAGHLSRTCRRSFFDSDCVRRIGVFTPLTMQVLTGNRGQPSIADCCKALRKKDLCRRIRTISRARMQELKGNPSSRGLLVQDQSPSTIHGSKIRISRSSDVAE
jgi:hypothetical protein